MKWLRFAALLFVFLPGLPAFAHHSRAGFDMNSIAVYQGSVAAVSWVNPHVYITLDLDDAQGQLTIETDAVAILRRAGWSADSLRAGERVLVRGNPGHDAHSALLVSVQKEDGSLLTPRSHFNQAATAAISRVPAESLAGIWELPFGDLGDYMERWAATPLTQAGEAGKLAFRPQDRPAGICIGTPTPQLMAMPYLNEVEVHDDVVIMRNEFLNAERTIYLDGRSHPENAQRSNQGHSIGRWEGEELVVDTVLFADHRAPIRGPNEGVPSGSQRHVTERYSLIEDRTRMRIEFTVEDPEYLAAPFSGTLEWVHVTGFEPMGFSCTPQ